MNNKIEILAGLAEYKQIIEILHSKDANLVNVPNGEYNGHEEEFENRFFKFQNITLDCAYEYYKN